MSAGVISIAKTALQTEVFAAALYQYLASRSLEDDSRKSFSQISEMELGHVNFWNSFLKTRGINCSVLKPNAFRLTMYKVMLRSLGRGLTLRLMETAENQAIEMYSGLAEDSALTEEEKSGLKNILADELIHENVLANAESKFESITAYIKDAVLGMSDGLVEILAVTTGLAGAAGNPRIVAVSGLVVGIAGAISMAIGTYTSTRSQRQVHEGIINRIVAASRLVGHIFQERVLRHLENKGYSHKVSTALAEETAQNQQLLSDTVAEQEYGLRKENLGQPSRAALYAGISNLVAAFIPLFPYFITSSITTALILSLILAIVALAVTGFFVSILAYMPPGKKIGEMIITGLGSAAVTYGIGVAASILFNVSQ